MSEKMRIAKEAMSIIAHRRLAAAKGVTNPDAYYATILADVRANHWNDALALAEDVTADQLATMLDGTNTKATAPARPVPDQRHGCPTCGCHGGGWLDAEERRGNGTLHRVLPCPDCAPDRARLVANNPTGLDTAAFDRRYHEQFNHDGGDAA